MRLPTLLVLSTLWFSCNVPVAEQEPNQDAGRPHTGADAGRDAGTPDAGPSAPVRLLFIYDSSSSLTVTDPNGERATALFDLLESAPATSDITFAVMQFTGAEQAFLTGNGLPAFVSMNSLSTNERSTLRQRILNFPEPLGTTDWVGPLQNAFVMLTNDTSNVNNAGLPRAKYAVIFITDGRPSLNQDTFLLCGGAVRGLRDLRIFASDVVVSTVHVFKPAQPATCSVDAGLTVGSQCMLPVARNPGCASTEVELDAERLRLMSVEGGGAFRDFRAGTEVDFTGLVP